LVNHVSAWKYAHKPMLALGYWFRLA